MLRWEAAFGWKPLRVEQIDSDRTGEVSRGIVPVIYSAG